MLIKNLSPNQWLKIKNLIHVTWPKISKSALYETHGDLNLIRKLITDTYGEDEMVNEDFESEYDAATFISNISKMQQGTIVKKDDLEDSNSTDILNPSYEKLSCNNLLN